MSCYLKLEPEVSNLLSAILVYPLKPIEGVLLGRIDPIRGVEVLEQELK